MPLLRKELAWFIQVHNSHRIRKQKDRKTPRGVPEDLYAFPEDHGMIYQVILPSKLKACKHDYMQVSRRKSGARV